MTPPRRPSKQEKIIAAHTAKALIDARNEAKLAPPVTPLKKSEIPSRLAVLEESLASTIKLAQKIARRR